MKPFVLALAGIAWSTGLLFAQHKPVGYTDSIHRFIANYVKQHEVVKGDDRKALAFFAPDPAYRVWATVEMQRRSEWFSMPTSGKLKKNYRVYALLHFTLKDTAVTMQLLQSQQLLGQSEYADYLFLPFTDETTGNTTYEAGRYLDFRLSDIAEGTLQIDFNKAYNPNCAYTSGYNCPIPPRANHLPVAILAGEKKYGKASH